MFNLTKSQILEGGVSQILKTNSSSQEKGLVLTRRDAVEMIQNRERILRATGRVELSFDVIEKLARKFCTSSFISQDDYAEILNELMDVFYSLKNESASEIPDDILIERMYDAFENTCEGCIELLSGKEMRRILKGCTPIYSLMNGEADEEWN